MHRAIMIHSGKEDFEVMTSELHRGIRHEMEHTKDRRKSMKIAIEHLREVPDYYSRLEHMLAAANRFWRRKGWRP
jgi:hypothetical protein